MSVLLPASTWPHTTKLRCGLTSRAASSASSVRRCASSLADGIGGAAATGDAATSVAGASTAAAAAPIGALAAATLDARSAADRPETEATALAGADDAAALSSVSLLPPVKRLAAAAVRAASSGEGD